MESITFYETEIQSMGAAVTWYISSFGYNKTTTRLIKNCMEFYREFALEKLLPRHWSEQIFVMVKFDKITNSLLDMGSLLRDAIPSEKNQMQIF